MALVAAGYVAGRRPPRAPADPPDSVSVAAFAPWRVGLAVLIVLTVVACAWNVWQPKRADDLANEAFALIRVDIQAALGKADEARDVNELSPKPLWAEAAALASAGSFDSGHDVLEEAVKEHPNLAEAWLRLADFRLDRLNDPYAALEAVEVALYLDPQSAAVRQSFIDIRDRLRAFGELPPDTAPRVPAE
jgi:tetratricopeptide (TPR) repeat protein